MPPIRWVETVCAGDSMLQLLQLTPLIVIVPLFIFWGWMFSDMTKNENLSSRSRSDWTLAFVVLNIFAAISYYFNEYRRRY